MATFNNAGYHKIVERNLNDSFTIHDVRAFRNRTPIGTKVRFETQEFADNDAGTGKKKITKHIEGTITGKFPHVVVLDGKYTYTWKDLMLNNVEVLSMPA